jgi:hypothetical protein
MKSGNSKGAAWGSSQSAKRHDEVMLRIEGRSTAPSPHEKWGEGNSPRSLAVIPLVSSQRHSRVHAEHDFVMTAGT